MLKRQRQGTTIISKLLKAVSMYRGLPSNIYYIAIARMVLGMGVTGAYLAGNFLGGKLSGKFGHKNIMVQRSLAL
ncbi:hypothetical protein OAA_08430 [Vibrio cyclitrophicus 1F175]|nr:hypothetical protein OAI_22570 [Vibrio cyclitrophicus FF160]OEF32076.1 hypothetical protein OA7_16170 [Vibrio cyclitrophicus 1F53]OEF66617.1 hypothetical protein OAA_08430 [Vibrio cyclitrophicus 1F175]PMH33138.1 hypothetical protein BCU72_15180 [Vibrio cyclitrophicus]PMI46328.1 hypothetical protein BCU44_08765 [Vibrio cyclitrophicus]